MAQLGGTFDATTVQPSGTRTLIAAGNYPAHVLRSDMIENNKKNGKFIWFEIEIIDGEYKGCTIETRMNIINPSAQAVEIAQRDLSALCHATGEMNVSDTEQLHSKPFLLTVKVKPAEGQYGPQSEVAGYKPLVAGRATGPSPVVTAPAAVASGPFGRAPAASAAPAAATVAKPGAAPWHNARAA